MPAKRISILGTRGIPATHGGFETFAEHLARHLVARDWDVTVYCQDDGGNAIYESLWQDVRCVHIPVAQKGALGTIIFDWKSTLRTARTPGLILTLGYNTAVFSAWYRWKGLTNLCNMDGIEWRRGKWGSAAKTWFYLNEWAGAWLSNHLIADNPEIKKHLSARVSPCKITTIPYGADRIKQADVTVLAPYSLTPEGYAVLIARAEPENSILEVVRAWSRRARGLKLVVLGNYDPGNTYQRAVRNAASNEVVFLGAIYEEKIVKALRFFARIYVHGHQVGGTNPSLVEALGAGNAVLAHDNPFNRWVAGDKSVFFSSEDDCAEALDSVLSDNARLACMRASSIERYSQAFTWDQILNDYEELLLQHSPGLSKESMVG